MDAEEKLGSIPTLREEGNDLFRRKRIAEAADKYSQALGMLEQLMLRLQRLFLVSVRINI